MAKKKKKNTNDEYAKKIVKGVVGSSSSKLAAKKVKKIDKSILIEKYTIKSEKSTDVDVEIRKKGVGIIYTLKIPEIDVATKALLEEIRNELITTTTIGMNEIMNPDALDEIRRRFLNESGALLNKKVPTIKTRTKDILVNKLLQDMLGLGEIEFLINDANLEEIVIPSAKEPIRVYHKKYGWLPSSLKIGREDEIVNYANIIARRVGRQITVLNPLLDAHLSSGDRINSVLYPISTKGNTITIRRFARDPYTIIDLIGNKTIDINVSVLLWLAIEYEMNIIFSGGTASGKTVILNACMPFIPPNHRIISVEDTRELMLPDFLYWTPMVTRSSNPEGKGEVSMLDLLVSSLRMRPDRIVLGEMRREEEAMVMFEAMHTGHSVYATMHANSATETISRLTNPPLSVPSNLLNAVNLNVVMFRDRRRGIRRVLQVAEFSAQDNRANATVLYRWIADTDTIVRHAESSKFFEDITKTTGMTGKEVEKNLEDKKNILNWLIKNKIRDLESFGNVMNHYYSDKEALLKEIRRNNVKMFQKGKGTR
ncbi:CpaF family protein [Candidatus Pacearchaeota archaeon]|nr:CpaF family protein [Candidatus Pacearchaeota archaeon]